MDSSRILLVLALLAMALPALGIDCYYGMTGDSDDEPGDDWDFDCSNGKEGCKETCDGDKAACFKVRYEGDSSFVSIYGCTSNWENPTSGGVTNKIPGDATYNSDSLRLDDLPDPADDECDEDGSVNAEFLPGTDDLGGGDISGVWCACNDEDECNGAERMGMAAAVVGSVVAVVMSRIVS